MNLFKLFPILFLIISCSSTVKITSAGELVKLNSFAGNLKHYLEFCNDHGELSSLVRREPGLEEKIFAVTVNSEGYPVYLNKLRNLGGLRGANVVHITAIKESKEKELVTWTDRVNDFFDQLFYEQENSLFKNEYPSFKIEAKAFYCETSIDGVPIKPKEKNF